MTSSSMIQLVYIILYITLTCSASCPITCQCTDQDTVIQCVDQVLFDIPQLPASTVTLNLSNIFVGPDLTTSFGYLTHLTHLYLSSNIIIRISNSTFRGLHNLTHLDLSNNKLKTLSDDLFLDNHNLQVLDLSGNAMSSMDAAFYRHLPQLKELHLSRNNFFQLKLGPRFQVLDQLQVLDLSYNDFADVANNAFETIDVWSNMVQRRLNLAHCKISTVENGTFIPYKGLFDLDISGVTTLSTDNISLIMKDIQHLNTKKLDMSFMNLHSVDTVFSSAPSLSLEQLNLSHNQLENISLNAFGNLGSLHHLDMSFNSMKLLQPSFTRVGNMKVLDISHNKLRGLNGPAISRMAKLEILKATHNEFSDRSLLQLNPLQQLKVLDLSHNTLNGLVTTGNNAKLEQLSLAANNITSLDMIPEAASLRVLDVSENKITQLGPYMFSASVNIQTVDFSGNLITVVDHLAFLPNSTNAYNINLSGNKLKRIHFGGWTSARVLNLSNNHMSYVDFHAFQGMNSLKVLDLSFNEIFEFEEETFKYLINLETLNLAHNRLESHLNEKRIKNTFTTLVSLKTIDMSSNNITHLDINVFEDNFNLVKLSLANNKFSTFLPELFKQLKKLQTLDIHGNPFMCNCEILPLLSWLQEIDPHIYGKLTHKYKCTGPSYRVGKSIFDFQVSFLECNEDLLELIVFGSLGGLSILVGIIGTIVCRSYQRWSEGVVSKKEKEKKTSKPNKVIKAKGTCTVEELPLEILDELDHRLKMKLMAAKQNGYSPLANGGPTYNKDRGDKSKVNTNRKETDKSKTKDRRDSSRSRSRSRSKDKQRSRSRSKSRDRDRSHGKDHDKREKRDRERLRRFEKELRYTLARYNPTSRWDAEGRDRWATMGGDWVSRREYNPVKADRFYTMPSYRHPRQTLLDDRELEKSEYSRVYRHRHASPADRKTSRSGVYSHDDLYQRRLSPVHRYDIVRVARRPDDNRYERNKSVPDRWPSHPGMYSKDAYFHTRDRQKSDPRWEQVHTEPRSRGDKQIHDEIKYGKTVDIKPEFPGRQETRTERQYVELPFPDTKDRMERQHKHDVTFLANRSRSYGSIDFKAKKRRFEEDYEKDLTPLQNEKREIDSDRFERYRPVFQVDNQASPTKKVTNQVEADVHNEEICRTPDPDYPVDNPKLSDWV